MPTWKNPVQSATIAQLCSELGFSGSLPGREEKVLTELTKKFPCDSLNQSTSLPFKKPHSTEACLLAGLFCNENGLGQSLWPDNTHQSWPSWPRERAKILRLVAHIFSLQAFNKHQYSCKNKTKSQEGNSTQANSSAPIMTWSQSSARGTRELSPESRKFVIAPPPKGTRRRPVKKSNSTVAFSSPTVNPSNQATELDYVPEFASTKHAFTQKKALMFYSAYTLANYIDHVESLDQNDDEGPLRGFTKKWLSKSSAYYDWPLQADKRLYYYMHTTEFYEPEVEDHKAHEVVERMRYGSEIAQTQPRETEILKGRILDRVRKLATEMQDKSIIAYKRGKLQMVKAFREVWDQRCDYWEKKAAMNFTENVTSETYKTLELYDDEEDDCVPQILRKKASSKGKQPMIQAKATSSIPKRKEPEDTTTQERNISSYFSPSPNKRQRIALPQDCLVDQNVCPSTELHHDQEIEFGTRKPGRDAKAVPQIREQEVKFPLKNVRPVAPQPVLSLPSGSREAQPMTPISPVQPPNIIRAVSQSPASPPRPSSNPAPEAVMTKSFSSTAYPSKSSAKGAEAVAVKDPSSKTPFFEKTGPKIHDAIAQDLPSTTASFGSTSSKISAAIAVAKNAVSTTPSVDSSYLGNFSTSFKVLDPLSKTQTPSFESRPPVLSPRTALKYNQKSVVQEIILRIQNSDCTWDLSKVYLAKDYLRTLDLTAFFAFFSQRSGVPLSDLESLTFKLQFGEHPQQIETIYQKSGDEDWKTLKGRIRSFFRFVKGGNSNESDFYIWIEIGDQRATVNEDDDEFDSDSIGF